MRASTLHESSPGARLTAADRPLARGTTGTAGRTERRDRARKACGYHGLERERGWNEKLDMGVAGRREMGTAPGTNTTRAASSSNRSTGEAASRGYVTRILMR